MEYRGCTPAARTPQVIFVTPRASWKRREVLQESLKVIEFLGTDSLVQDSRLGSAPSARFSYGWLPVMI
jgi:hypothetical protein